VEKYGRSVQATDDSIISALRATSRIVVRLELAISAVCLRSVYVMFVGACGSVLTEVFMGVTSVNFAGISSVQVRYNNVASSGAQTNCGVS
jgi:hypothetical protein